MAYTTLSYAALPPHVHLSVPAPITETEALEHIQTYLQRTTRLPYLHPDAVFTDTGMPTSALNDKTGGLILHQLRRVEKGLQGEVLGVDVEYAGLHASVDTPDGDIESGASQTRLAVPAVDVNELDEPDTNAPPQPGDDEAPEAIGDLGGNYQQQLGALGEGTEEGDIDNRLTAISGRRTVPKVQPTLATSKRKAAEVEGMTELDKEARKRAKKERHRAMQREKELERGRNTAKSVVNSGSRQTTTIADSLEDEQSAYEEDLDTEFGAMKSPIRAEDSTSDAAAESQGTHSQPEEQSPTAKRQERGNGGTVTGPKTVSEFYEAKSQSDGISQVEENEFKKEKKKKNKSKKKGRSEENGSAPE